MHVLAYSMGGRIALEALINHNAPFLSLTCLSTTLSIDNLKNRLLLEQSWIDKLKNHSIKEFIDFWYSQNLFKDFNIPPKRYTQKKEDLIKVLQEYSITKSNISINDIQNCKTPIQFIYRKKDPKAFFLQDYSNLTYVNSPNHAIHIESYEEVVSLLYFSRETKFIF
ncbi:MAG: 2-succinyl-6-hydroxy-2,4-cyclohexadiene-1-carboxylate synthase [Chlamydiia bacterium]|nr:2-succinyl-6-hydroxy-2,4-cyclohexadiene-1-carboxylate synthase [Chlamydiia bacterium]